MYFDTHAHYDDRQFDTDRTELIRSLPEKGISLVVNPGCDIASSRVAVQLAEAYPFFYAGVGVHPHRSQDMDESSIPELEDLGKNPRVVALGEIGLDYHYDNSPRDIQKLRFIQQMELARKLKLPVIIHEREAVRDTLEIIKKYKDVAGVVHCFSGSVETAKIILNQGWYLSFTGIITYNNARKSHEVIRYMPRDRIMIETDAPYLSPTPLRGERNSSLNLPYIAAALARLLNISPEQAACLTLENGKRFFAIE